MPLLTELVFLCNGSARKGVPDPVSQILVLKDPRPFRPRYIESGLQPLVFRVSLSHPLTSLTLSPLSLCAFSRFTDSCAKRSEALQTSLY